MATRIYTHVHACTRTYLHLTCRRALTSLLTSTAVCARELLGRKVAKVQCVCGDKNRHTCATARVTSTTQNNDAKQRRRRRSARLKRVASLTPSTQHATSARLKRVASLPPSTQHATSMTMVLCRSPEEVGDASRRNAEDARCGSDVWSP